MKFQFKRKTTIEVLQKLVDDDRTIEAEKQAYLDKLQDHRDAYDMAERYLEKLLENTPFQVNDIEKKYKDS